MFEQAFGDIDDVLRRRPYHDSIADAGADFGRVDEIGKMLAGLHRSLYEKSAAPATWGDLKIRSRTYDSGNAQ